jgi:preprotein translocase subunit SecD
MPNNIGETSLVSASLADSVFPNRTTASVSAFILTLSILCMIYRIWPMRLTNALVAFMNETEKLYYDAVEAGELPGDVGIEEKLLR